MVRGLSDHLPLYFLFRLLSVEEEHAHRRDDAVGGDDQVADALRLLSVEEDHAHRRGDAVGGDEQVADALRLLSVEEEHALSGLSGCVASLLRARSFSFA